MDALSNVISEFFTEPVFILIQLGGLVLMAISYVWLMFRAIDASKWWWIGFIPPFGLLYLFSFSRRVVGPLILLLLGVVVAATPFVLTRYVQPLLPTHPWQKMVDGEMHVTLTGLPAFNYSTLKSQPQIAVLQMANKDVTDATLENLRGHDVLYELDLNDTAITDSGLAIVKTLPSLKKLRIARTAVTDDGFKKQLFDNDTLTHLDVTGTAVTGPTLRAWKNAKEGRQYVK